MKCCEVNHEPLTEAHRPPRSSTSTVCLSKNAQKPATVGDQSSLSRPASSERPRGVVGQSHVWGVIASVEARRPIAGALGTRRWVSSWRETRREAPSGHTRTRRARPRPGRRRAPPPGCRYSRRSGSGWCDPVVAHGEHTNVARTTNSAVTTTRLVRNEASHNTTTIGVKPYRSRPSACPAWAAEFLSGTTEGSRPARSRRRRNKRTTRPGRCCRCAIG